MYRTCCIPVKGFMRTWTGQDGHWEANDRLQSLKCPFSECAPHAKVFSREDAALKAWYWSQLRPHKSSFRVPVQEVTFSKEEAKEAHVASTSFAPVHVRCSSSVISSQRWSSRTRLRLASQQQSQVSQRLLASRDRHSLRSRRAPRRAGGFPRLAAEFMMPGGALSATFHELYALLPSFLS